jgi:hypothetical protein
MTSFVLKWVAFVQMRPVQLTDGAKSNNSFEFSHFMSPQSSWPAANNLFDRYVEYFDEETVQ